MSATTMQMEQDNAASGNWYTGLTEEKKMMVIDLRWASRATAHNCFEALKQFDWDPRKAYTDLREHGMTLKTDV